MSNKNKKRYQECNRLEKIWRRRHYISIPFIWLAYMFKTYIYKLLFDKETNNPSIPVLIKEVVFSLSDAASSPDSQINTW